MGGAGVQRTEDAVPAAGDLSSLPPLVHHSPLSATPVTLRLSFQLKATPPKYLVLKEICRIFQLIVLVLYPT